MADKMTPWERFGIDHLSYSSIDLAGDNLMLWCLRYLAKMPGDVGAGAWRGTAVGVGLAEYSRTGDQAKALQWALSRFDQEAKGKDDPKDGKERSLISAFLETAIAHTSSDQRTLIEAERKIEYHFDGLDIPLIGYVDLIWAEPPFTELKTTLRMPSAAKDNHIGQVALYSAAIGQPGEILYVTDKKTQLFPVGGNQAAQALGKLRRNALALQKFLSKCESVKDAIQSVPVRTDDWKWNEAATLKLEEFAA